MGGGGVQRGRVPPSSYGVRPFQYITWGAGGSRHVDGAPIGRRGRADLPRLIEQVEDARAHVADQAHWIAQELHGAQHFVELHQRLLLVERREVLWQGRGRRARRSPSPKTP